ncbi:hypothetical protein PanWU01x14_090690 [Parasponia andersonii]|uniref:Uncharacterized protein n=1 Tax=Parasponia andersonii TaxID=3476 RepID=A0A2P5D6Z9_PARAD|nr:hypothetical protein PanWU01x14_090690 [Parasponia andersonii]
MLFFSTLYLRLKSFTKKLFNSVTGNGFRPLPPLSLSNASLPSNCPLPLPPLRSSSTPSASSSPNHRNSDIYNGINGGFWINGINDHELD